MATKQIIVMRTDLSMRKGKMVAQGAHASMAVLTQFKSQEQYPPVLKDWLANSFTKICVGVGSENELRAIHKEASDAGLLCSFIVDNGATEFHGIPTPTCIAIGPAEDEVLKPITGNLKLL